MKLNKISYKIFFGMLLLSSMILLIMTNLVKQSYTNFLKKNEINFHVLITSGTKYRFDSIISVMDGAVREIIFNHSVLAALSARPSVPPEPGDFTVNVYLQGLQQVQPFLGDISILGVGGQFCSSNTSLKRSDMEKLFAKYKSHFENGGSMEYFVNPGEHQYPQNTYQQDVLTGVWPIFNIKTQRLLGIIFVGLNYTIFQEMFILSPIINKEKFFMIDSSGKIVFSQPSYESFEQILRRYPELRERGDRIIEGQVLGVDSIIVSENSANLGFKFIRIIDSKNVTSDTRKMQSYFNIVFAVSIIICLVFSLYISRKLTKPVAQLFDACKKIEKGDMSFRVNIRSGDEMGQLGRTFNLIMDEIGENFERELVEQKRQNELKLEILRAQINPHFLYNTLDSIKFLATLQENHNIASMSASLINLLKYNLSSKTVTMLKEEIESVSNYVDIQKYRYGDIFEFTTDIAKETERCVISRFVLQPLVENCLIHSFDGIESGGKITIRSFLETEALNLQVIDNGSGIDEETMNRLRDGMDAQDNPYSKIGVSNIRERIRLQFGESATLSYSAGDGGGTIATLCFPVSG
jgi:two-component system, sensor histidine kinase YesM